MALSQPRSLYGIHSIAPYARSTGLPYGILLVLGGANLELTSEQEQLFGGSNKFAWATESKTVSTQFTANVKSFEDFLFTLFLGASVTASSSAEASGAIATALTNVNGTSMVNATTGLASVAITTAADAKFGKYIIVATADDDFDVYCTSDIDFLKGTDLTYQNDLLKITASPLAIGDTGATVAIPGTGLTITGGSGTVALVAGDTCEFRVRPINTGNSVIDFGQSNTVFPEFGCVLLAQKQANFEMMEVELYKCVGSGMPINLQETAFAVSDLTITALYDSSKNKVGTFRHVEASS